MRLPEELEDFGLGQGIVKKVEIGKRGEYVKLYRHIAVFSRNEEKDPRVARCREGEQINVQWGSKLIAISYWLLAIG
jgi:hypothetical protein